MLIGFLFLFSNTDKLPFKIFNIRLKWLGILYQKIVKFAANAKNWWMHLYYTDKLPFKISNLRLKSRKNFTKKIVKIATNARNWELHLYNTDKLLFKMFSVSLNKLLVFSPNPQYL